jgi:general secretion pathway protein A
MYETFFGLARSPFGISPDPHFLFLTAAHREALAGLVYAIVNRKGFVVLSGDAGTGKTTLLRAVVDSMPANLAQFGLILNPALTRAEFLELAMLEFGMPEIPPNKAKRLVQFREFLLRNHAEGKLAVLFVDEAHRLSANVLEEIRLLSNFETVEGRLHQIVLAAQGALAWSAAVASERPIPMPTLARYRALARTSRLHQSREKLG